MREIQLETGQCEFKRSKCGQARLSETTGSDVFQDYDKFSPWLPDAYEMQVNASASGIFGEAGFSAGVAMDSCGIAPFISAGTVVGVAPPGIDFSLQFTMSERVNLLKKHTDLSFVNGADIGETIGAG
ncbi:hypothetical protein [Dyadobacter sp. CY323]|uniref:hypothetical protein n=1 Tax=Dyadobacter sp. CY323 TaxID=2907302 RepID=UPI001F186288|nr:hypothetical protein [Dyadobacter sp. CY323]MCE6988587.1 hypothetical protein [Dyadobacter sp. CY323]